MSSMHSWEIHAEQGRYHAWRLSTSGGVAAREDLRQGFAPKYRGNPKHSKAESRWRLSCIDERLRHTTTGRIPDPRETYAEEMMSRRRVYCGA